MERRVCRRPVPTAPPTDDDTPTNLFLTYRRGQGDTLLDNSKARCRRVMFGMTDRSFANFFTADGKKLFGQAVDWAAAACCGASGRYGKGLAGTGAVVPTLTTSAPPVFSAKINVVGTNSSGAATSALLIVGNTRLNVPFLGGTLLVNPILQVGLPCRPPASPCR